MTTRKGRNRNKSTIKIPKIFELGSEGVGLVVAVVQVSVGGEPGIHRGAPVVADHFGLVAEVVVDQAPCPAHRNLEVEVERVRWVVQGEVHTRQDGQVEAPDQVDIHAAVEVGYMVQEVDSLVWVLIANVGEVGAVG